MRKIVLDSSAIMRDYTILDRYDKEEIIIPLTVIDELDKGKRYDGDAGWNARNGIKLILQKKIDVWTCKNNEELDNDQKIILAASKIKEEIEGVTDVVLLTDDFGMVVRSKQFQDKFTAKISSDESFENNYGRVNKIFVDTIAIDTIVDDGCIYPDGIEMDSNLPPWSQVQMIASSSCSVLAYWNGEKLIYIPDVSGKNSPKNMEQRFCYEALRRSDVPLVTITGQAGTGKTFLTLLAGLEGVLGLGRGGEKNWEKLVLVKNFQEVGKGLGFLPGSLEEKMEPWLDSVKDTMNAIYGKNSAAYFSKSVENKQIEIVPMSYIRGRTFSKSYIVMDESQNTTPHEIKTVLTRTGEGSKIVLLGDTRQVDSFGYGENSCGLANVVRKFRDSKMAAHCTLSVTHRSDIAGEAARLL